MGVCPRTSPVRNTTTEVRTGGVAGAHGLDPLGFLQSKYCDTPEKLQLMKEKEIKHCERRRCHEEGGRGARTRG